MLQEHLEYEAEGNRKSIIYVFEVWGEIMEAARIKKKLTC